MIAVSLIHNRLGPTGYTALPTSEVGGGSLRLSRSLLLTALAQPTMAPGASAGQKAFNASVRASGLADPRSGITIAVRPMARMASVPPHPNVCFESLVEPLCVANTPASRRRN